MRPASFEYHRPESIDEAVGLLDELGEEARVLAGGYSLVPMMNLRLARPEHLVDINRLPLDRIERAENTLRLGGLVRHHRYESDEAVKGALPLLAEASDHIAHPVIRLRGTLGGSLANADPTAELSLLAVLYDAVIEAKSIDGTRRIDASDFFKGAFMTALKPGEIITALEIAIPTGSEVHAFLEFSERKGDFAIVAVAASLSVDGGRITQARVACAGASSVPQRNAAVEQFLCERLSDPSVVRQAGRLFADAVDPPSDIRATSAFRKHLVAELTARTLEKALAEAGIPR